MVAHGYARNVQEAEAFGQVQSLIRRLLTSESGAKLIESSHVLLILCYKPCNSLSDSPRSVPLN